MTAIKIRRVGAGVLVLLFAGSLLGGGGAISSWDATPGVHGEADTENCLTCHENLRAVLEKDLPHAPAADGDCLACHSAHAARYDHLLKARERALCAECHEDSILDYQHGFVHTPVRQGECALCHDPHGSDFVGLLRMEGTELCLGCHAASAEETKLPHGHSPFVDGDCSDCHRSHNSPYRNQLTHTPRELCLECHDDDGEDVVQAHRGISVRGTNCGQCHDPHASTRAGLLRAFVHEPFRTGECSECHGAGATSPGTLVATGARLCHRCHDGYPAAEDTVVHAPLREGDCGSCHSSHAGDIPGLLTKVPRDLCLSCHQDIQTRMESSRTAHPVVDEKGSCLMCHQAHSSREPALLLSDGIRTCLPCHDGQTHGHPLGSETMDPRTGKTMTCLSCHDPHGTAYPFHLVGDQNRGLCLECHSGERKLDDGHSGG